MSLTCADLFQHLATLLGRDTRLAALLPLVTQVADEAAAQEAARDYDTELARVLESRGLALVAVAAEASSVAAATAPVLDLEHTVMLCIVENPRKNQTGETAWQCVRRALRVLHRGNVSAASGARTDVRLGSPAYTLGPLGQGKVVYFVNLLLRTSEPLGALPA